MGIVCAESGLLNLGKASPSNFQLLFQKIPTEPSINAMNPLILNIFSTVIPGISFAEEELYYQTNKTKRASGPLNYEQWSFGFVIDSEFSNWKIINNWMRYYNNNYNKVAEKHKNYSVDASLVITDNYRKNIMSLRFVDIWPMSLSEVSLSQREGDAQLECTANFNYDYFLIVD
jgi:hypothetical protein